MDQHKINDTIIVDSRQDAGRTSPGQTWKPHIRRRRVGLSCRVCKMRKVRCDRQSPVCMKCATGGWMNLCSYEGDQQTPRMPLIRPSSGTSETAPANATQPALQSDRQHHHQQHQSQNQPQPQHPRQSQLREQHEQDDLHTSGDFVHSDTRSFVPLTSDFDSSAPMELGTNATIIHRSALDQIHHNMIQGTESSSQPIPSQDTSSTVPFSVSPAVSMHPDSACSIPLEYSSESMEQYFNNNNIDLAPGAFGFGTSFHGSTSSVSCATTFPYLADTMQKLTEAYVPAGDDATMTPPSRLASGWSSPLPKDHLTLLPPQFRCRQLMQAYFKHYNMIFRIIHAPVFWKQYNDFWAGPRTITSHMPYLLFAAMSCVRCLEPDNPILYDGDSSVASREAALWFNIAKEWADEQGLKHATLEFFQLKCLLMLSMKLNLIKMRTHYPLSQSLLATAMAAGLHRSANTLNQPTSFYEQEMRRRIWWTITELDLAECTERGLPSLVENLFVDNEPPSNFADADLNEDTTYRPVDQLEQVFTESSFARQSKSMQPLRYMVITLANNPVRHCSLTSSEITDLHDKVLGCLDGIVTSNTFQSPQSSPQSTILCRTMLELLLHELLQILHLPFALGLPGQVSHHHSRFVCQGSARHTIESYRRLKKVGFSQSCLPRTYIQRAVLVLCRLDTVAPIMNSIYSHGLDAETALNLVLETFDIFEERIIARGNGFRGFWLTFAASCYLKANSEEPAATLWKEKISSRIIALCSKVSMSQNTDNQSEEQRDAVFAKYMRHLRRAGVFAGFGVSELQITASGTASARS